MRLKILHLNIERSKHINVVMELLENKNPDVACFEEARLEDVEMISQKLKYEFAFSPLIRIQEGDSIKEEGSAILSKFPILEVNKYRYDLDKSQDAPIRVEKEIISNSHNVRAKDRFSYHSTLLAISINCDDSPLTVSTTHFPVVDHNSFGLGDHELENINVVDEMENMRSHLDRLITIIRSINRPMIFTADLNNTRGEYVYDTLAHELVDIVPISVVSTIDPKLHRNPELKLLVDTIMISPQISANSFEIIEGVSDHKALLASLSV